MLRSRSEPAGRATESSSISPFHPLDQGLSILDRASAEGRLSASALKNIRAWLTEPRTPNTPRKWPSCYRPESGRNSTTSSGRSFPSAPAAGAARCIPIGSNAINDRTIGESAQGLADYVKDAVTPAGTALACAIAYDTRHRSRQFAELCAEIMVAAGFTVYFLDGYRSTPELSFAVRYKKCSLRHHGHRQPQPAQRQRGEGLLVDRRAALPPHDKGVIDRVMACQRDPRASRSPRPSQRARS